MAGLVDGDAPLLVRAGQAVELLAEDDLVDRPLEVAGGDLVGAVAAGGDGRLVDEAFEVGAGKPERIGGHDFEIDVGG